MIRALTYVITLLASVPAGAQTLYGQSGRCQSLTLADHGVSGQCEDTIFTARFAGDRFGFVLIIQDGTHVAFTWPAGVDEDPTGSTPGDRVVSRVDFVVRNEVEWLPSNGVCTIGKAYNTDTAIVCDATTEKGRFAVQFQTEAREPPKKLFGSPLSPNVGKMR